MFRLALAIGCTIRELEARMDSREFAEWEAYFAIEPWGEERADLRAALLTCLTANLNRKKGAPPYRPADFMPYREPEKQETKDAELRAFLRRKSGEGR